MVAQDPALVSFGGASSTAVVVVVGMDAVAFLRVPVRCSQICWAMEQRLQDCCWQVQEWKIGRNRLHLPFQTPTISNLNQYIRTEI